ncbi:hypothetical protein C7C46_11980 [Streptomyces tateyamensis]|uniref:Uncharacterized protein n=1 Tax=Streptomyces tateyamensis TaxID=565073 RepID=A0A2V4N9E3_9ACTN|nr:hypothetical protein [Streptomyces tateyamensis]PYC80858.1 hypothetical protein C7C46_11980 [Streptomyces tateyamensis]
MAGQPLPASAFDGCFVAHISALRRADFAASMSGSSSLIRCSPTSWSVAVETKTLVATCLLLSVSRLASRATVRRPEAPDGIDGHDRT